MITDKERQQAIRRVFGFLESGGRSFHDRFMQSASLANLDKGQYVCHEGLVCSHLALVTRGTARVFKLGENGREITLYRVGPGESCILTASCILSDQPFPASAVCETDIEAVVVSAAEVRAWLADSGAWRDYVFGLLSRRLSNIISVIEEVVFRRMDRRIAAYLCQHSSDLDTLLHATHQEIASDLGTSREVVSRILKDFEGSGLIHVRRGAISLLNREGLIEKTRES
jgi:CRP/FNR family transcriptional regulator